MPIACTCADGRSGAGICGDGACDCPPTYALIAEPGSLDFGEVAPGTEREAEVVLRNPAPRAVAIRSAQVFGASDTYRLDGGRLPAIPAGGAVPVTVRFSAGTAGTPVARLRVEPDDADVAPVEVLLTARVPGPLLACMPDRVDFGNVWLGETSTAAVVCVNAGLAGASDDARLSLASLEVEGPGFTAAWRGAAPAMLAVGESATVEVRLAPVVTGEHWGTLAIGSDAGGVEIPLAGRAAELPACDVALVPEQLRFGAITEGTTATAELAIRNRRLDAPCLVHGVRLCEGTDPALTIVGGPYDDVLVPGGGELRIALRVTPEAESCAAERDGCIEFDLSPSPDGHRSLPFSCEPPVDLPLRVSPSRLDFGAVEAGCATRDREFALTNTSSTTVHLGRVELNEGISEEIFIRSFPPRRTAIEPGESAWFTLAYRPVDVGQDLGSVRVWVEERADPLVVSLAGSARASTVQQDMFRIPFRTKLDLLLVIDNGSTMAAEAPRLVYELRGLPDRMAIWNVDARLAVTTTGLVAGGPGCPGGANGGEDGRFFPIDNSRPRILDLASPDLGATWAANLAVGTCHTAPPQALEATVRALTPPLSTSAEDPRHPEVDDGNLGFLRPDARLLVLVVSDRADASPGTDDAYYQALVALKGGQADRVSFVAITGDRRTGCTDTDGRAAVAGDRLYDFLVRFDGWLESICGEDWLTDIFGFPTTFGPRRCFFLGNQPEDRNANGVVSDIEDEIRVFIDEAVVPSSIDGDPVWEYSKDQIAVCFAPDHVPGEGSLVEVDYFVSCMGW